MENLRKIRIINGYTQKEFATIIGVPSNTYNQWETGKRQPDYETLSRIADFYDVTVDYLLGRNPSKQENPIKTNKALPDIFYQYNELSEDRQKEVLAFVEFKVAQQKEQEALQALSNKEANEAQESNLKRIIDLIDAQIATGEFDPKDAKIAAFGGYEETPEGEEAEKLAEIKRLIQLVQEEQRERQDK